MADGPADLMTDEFIDGCVATAADLALFFCGVSDLEMIGALYQLRADFQAELAQKFGSEVSALIAEALVATVVGRRREIEAGGATPRVLN